MEEHTYWWHFWDRSIEYLLYKHGDIIVNIVNLDNEFRWGFQWLVVSSVNNESCQLILCFLFSVQSLKCVYITTGFFHFKNGVGIFTLNNVLGVVVPYAWCDLEEKRKVSFGVWMQHSLYQKIHRIKTFFRLSLKPEWPPRLLMTTGVLLNKQQLQPCRLMGWNSHPDGQLLAFIYQEAIFNFFRSYLILPKDLNCSFSWHIQIINVIISEHMPPRSVLSYSCLQVIFWI